MIEHVHLFHCGWISVPRPLFEQGQALDFPRMPLMGAIAEHADRGPILIDAPLGREGPANVGRLSAGLLKMAGFRFETGWSVAARLEQTGHRAGDVDDVLMTHMHVDHTGGLKTLADATIHTSDVEWEYARGRSALTGKAEGYAPDDYRPLADRIDTFEMPPELGTDPEGVDVLGDGSIRAVGLPGHTIGHVGYRLQMTDGREVMHVGDAAFTTRHVTNRRELGIFPRSFAYDVPRAKESLRALRKFHDDRTDIELINAHDFDLAEQCMEGPIEV